jgi:hypothetical protein
VLKVQQRVQGIRTRQVDAAGQNSGREDRRTNRPKSLIRAGTEGLNGMDDALIDDVKMI